MIITIIIVTVLFVCIGIAGWLEDSNREINADYIREHYLEIQERYK